MPKKKTGNRSPTGVQKIVDLPDVETQIAMARQLHASLMSAAGRALEIAQAKIEKNPTLRDATYAMGTFVDKAEVVRKNLDALEGNNSHTLASMARQLEGLAAAQRELERREAIDVTPEKDDDGADA